MNSTLAALAALQALVSRLPVAWMRRCSVVSLGFGLFFACLDVAAQRWLGVDAGQEFTPVLQVRSVASGIAATAAAYGLFGGLYAGFTGTLSTGRRRRWLAAAGLGVLLSGALLANLVSAVLCLYSGSYLTYGALQFTLNSFSHVSGAAFAGHATSLMVIGAGSVLLCGGLTWLIGRSSRSPGRARARKHWAAASLGVPSFVAIVGFEGFEEPAFQHEVWGTTPELAFYSSLERVVPGGRRDDAGSKRTMRPGPELTMDAIWETASVPTARPPNVLLILLESVSTRYLGSYGSSAGVTPHLDRLAAGGLQMRRAWTTATHSNYAQMAVLSSLFPRRGRGLDTYRNIDYPRFLFHDTFHHLGYSTATVSSQDETWQGMSRFQDTGTPTHYIDARSHDGTKVDIISEHIVPDHETRRLAIDWIRRQQQRPWALYVNFQATHFPYKLAKGVPRPFKPNQPTAGQFDYLRYPESDHRIAVNRYKNALSYVDEQIGRLADGLRQMSQLDNTLIAITSDHGEMFHDHGVVTHGRTLYEAEARVPLVLHWPDGIEPAASNEQVSTLDVLPTILDAVGVAPHPSHQGSSFLGQVSPSASRKAVLLNIQGLRSFEGIVCWPHKLVRDVATGKARLFDLERDPEENIDLSAAHTDHALELHRLLRGVMREQDAYHRAGNPERTERFAPRIPDCPD